MKTLAFIIGTYIALHGAVNWATATGEALNAKHSLSYASESKEVTK